MTRVVLNLLFVCFLSIVSYGSILHVPQDYNTIQSAISSASDGDTVLVSPGVYDENIDFSGKNVVLTSLDPNDPAVVSSTTIFRKTQRGRFGDVIATPGNGSIVSFVNEETSSAVLRGFTIMGGYGTRLQNNALGIPSGYFGAGILCQGSSPTITHNIIRDNVGPMTFDNQPSGVGGGIYCENSDAFVAYNTIVGNKASVGGGVCTFISNGAFFSNVIADNEGVLGGGAVTIGGRFINNTLANNTTSSDDGIGGNLYVILSEAEFPTVFTNNIIFGAKDGFGIVIDSDNFGDWFTYNNVYDNVPGDYVNLSTDQPSSGATGQQGNISVNPEFVDLSENDYRLMDTSPCIDAGDPLFDLTLGALDMNGSPRLFGAAIDIGAYENTVCTRPVADAGPDQTVITNQIVTLNGDNSLFCDPNTPQRFIWDQLEGPAVNLSDPLAINPTFTPSKEGVYRIELIVSDGSVFSRPDTVTITVDAPHSLR